VNNPELIATILKRGGRVLIVGGETKDLPRPYQEHAQILIWDDDKINILNREIPSNVKVIMWNRWISHSTVARLNNAAKQLHAIKFPMLRSREIKELLSEVVQTDALDVPDTVVEEQIEQAIQTTPEIQETTVAKHVMLKPGLLQQFLAKNIDLSVDYSIKGSKSKEGKRLFEVAQRDGVKTTIMSITNALGIFLKQKASGGKTAARIKAKTESHTGDDFQELERLIEDAIVAMKLVQEHLPKVRKETERLRGMREKVLKLFSLD